MLRAPPALDKGRGRHLAGSLVLIQMGGRILWHIWALARSAEKVPCVVSAL